MTMWHSDPSRWSNRMKYTVEICCGSYYDGVQAILGGAKRIELNSALHMGGLTPSIAHLRMLKQNFDCTVITMARVRGGGFCYNQLDKEAMFADVALLLENGADGSAFGVLDEHGNIDTESSRKMIEFIHSAGKQAVFHRAFDWCNDPYRAIEQLVELQADRILTSGGKPTAQEGKQLIKELQMRYGNQIELLAGSGINETNAKEIITDCGITQIHSSCKCWISDPTTISANVSYAYASAEFGDCYDAVDQAKVKALINSIQ